MNTEAAIEDNRDIMYHGQVAEMRSRVQIALDVQHIRKILENNDSDWKGDNVAVSAIVLLRHQRLQTVCVPTHSL